MGNSLQDQLVNAGLADPKQAKKAGPGGKKQPKVKKKDRAAQQTSASTQAAQQAQAAKLARDRELNQRRAAEAARKAARAQIRQLIDGHKLDRVAGEIGYNFVDGSKVRKIYITDKLRGQLTTRQAMIVKLEGRYDIVPSEIAEKIRERDARCVMERQDDTQAPVDDDPYAAFQVPDDLIW